MTHESSNDSPRHEPGISPRRAARAARENAERENAAAPAAPPGESAADATAKDEAAAVAAAQAAASAEAQALAAAKAAEEERIRAAAGERTKALDAAQRARTQGALRARQEAIEAQRAAAERVRQTLRANAAPLRDRSASARSAVSPDSPETAPVPAPMNASAPVEASANTEPTPASVNAPYDQDTAQQTPPETANSPADAAPKTPPAAPKAPPAMPPPVPDETTTHDVSAADPSGPGEATPDRDAYAAEDPADSGSLEAHDAGHHPAPEAGDAEHYSEHPGDPHGAEAHPLAHDEELERENLFLTTGTANPSARKARRRRRNWILTAVLLGFCAVIFGVVIFLQGILAKLNPADFPGPGGEAIAFEVKPGWGPKQIGRELESRDIVATDKLFLESIQLVEAESREIHPGTYNLRLEMPALDAATILIGEPAQKVSYIAIKQNTRLPQVLEEIQKSTGLEAAELNALAEDPKAFGIDSGAKNLEGYMHPGEYRFPLESDAKTVLQAMVDATTKTLAEAGITDPEQQYHVLKVASILQAEARPNDYGTVAGALENRLHPSNTETNGLLQVDSSVIYGLDRYTLQISGAEKIDAGNPYNTYVHRGLPPTPIGSPGDPAITAAANPTPNDYYYWVTVNTNTGETKFARTYAEHLVNQNEFRAWCAANTDVCK